MLRGTIRDHTTLQRRPFFALLRVRRGFVRTSPRMPRCPREWPRGAEGRFLLSEQLRAGKENGLDEASLLRIRVAATWYNILHVPIADTSREAQAVNSGFIGRRAPPFSY